MADPDLLAFAKQAGSEGDDLFSLLSVDATASESDIRRAFRKKALTAHPDKAGDKYDPALYEKLEKSRDVLINKEAREIYENGMKAILQKRKQLEMMGEKRRRLVEDLELREKEAEKRMKMSAEKVVEDDRIKREMVERGKRKMEERRRVMEEAERREKEREEREYEDKIRELERKLEEKKAKKAAKKARKGEKDDEDGHGHGNSETSSHPPPRPPSPPPAPDGSTKQTLAKESKVAAAPNSAAGHPPAPPPQPAPTESSDGAMPKPSDRFAATMARLRAAQAKKDEEKRRTEAAGGAAAA